eukprot:2823516-Rhodomonas_salina.1
MSAVVSLAAGVWVCAALKEAPRKYLRQSIAPAQVPAPSPASLFGGAAAVFGGAAAAFRGNAAVFLGVAPVFFLCLRCRFDDVAAVIRAVAAALPRNMPTVPSVTVLSLSALCC